MELRFSAENESEIMDVPRVNKILGNGEGPQGMEILVEWMDQPSLESRWVVWQKLAGVTHWLCDFFSFEGEESKSKRETESYIPFLSENSQSSFLDPINAA